MIKEKEVFPVFDKIIQKADKEILLNQKAKAIWLSGLSGAGKTSLGIELEKKLFSKNYLTQILDGDNIRSGINKNLKFTEEDRLENIRRIAEVTKLFLNCGVITINCFITPTNAIRQIVREIIGAENLIEIYVNSPIEVCESRDKKGLYKRAKSGELKNFTGISSPFEVPDEKYFEIKTDSIPLEKSAQILFDYIIEKIKK